MSQYTTGEIAKACGVTVRTVQFYDQKGILIPSALSEGGRRLYSEEDLKKKKIRKAPFPSCWCSRSRYFGKRSRSAGKS